MDKKIYNKPELTVVKLTSMSHLLVDSWQDGGGDLSPKNSNPSRSASFSTFDGEE